MTEWPHTPNDPKLTADEIRALGEIVIVWGHIEADLQHFIWEYVNKDVSVGAAITVGMSLEAKTRLLRELAELKEDLPFIVGPLLELLKRVDQLRSTRNDMVHAYWIDSRPQNYKKIVREGRHPWDMTYKPPKVDIIEFRDKSAALCHDLWKLMGSKMIIAFDPMDASPESHLPDPGSM